MTILINNYHPEVCVYYSYVVNIFITYEVLIVYLIYWILFFPSIGLETYLLSLVF